MNPSPRSLRVNAILTAAWALAFAVVVGERYVDALVPAVPRSLGVATTVVALIGALLFTAKYPDRTRP